jgi:hypothetical protein
LTIRGFTLPRLLEQGSAAALANCSLNKR